MKLVIRFDQQVMLRYHSRGASPIFYIHWLHSQIAYPSEDWMDFGVVILDWWIVAAHRLLNGSTKEDFQFMDGPYCISIRAEDNFVFLSSKGVSDDWTASLEELISELLGGARLVTAELARLNIAHRERDILERKIEEMEKLRLSSEILRKH